MNENIKNNNKNNPKREVVYTDYNIFNGKVRLVGEGGQPIIIDRDDAIDIAKSRGMNLVQIAYNKQDNPRSICKIIDYSKFKYEQKKKEKESKKRQKAMVAEVKEIKFSIRIDEGDKETKINKIKEILDDGDKVKLTIHLLRRELADHPEFAKETMRNILIELDDYAEMDVGPSFTGSNLSCVLKKKK